MKLSDFSIGMEKLALESLTSARGLGNKISRLYKVRFQNSVCQLRATWIIRIREMIIRRGKNEAHERYGPVKSQRWNEECLNSEYLPVIAASRGIVISKFNPEAEQEAG